MLCGY